MLYGKYVSELEGLTHHKEDPLPLCRVVWDRNKSVPNHHGLSDFIAQMKPEQVAVGIQSFIGLDMEDVRQVANSFRSYNT